MTTTPEPNPQPAPVMDQDPPGARTGVGGDTADHSFWHGRSGLVLALLMAAFSSYLLYGVLTTKVPEGTDFPGPTFFPTILLVVGYLLAALLVLHYLRSPEPVEEHANAPWRFYTDWTSVAWCVGGFLILAAGIEFLGWIFAAAALFWCVARGAGSRRPIFDATLGLLVASVIYLAFAGGLGLNLPSGILGGI